MRIKQNVLDLPKFFTNMRNYFQALDISQTLSQTSCQELRVERRSVFRLTLPDKRSVGVKAKPHRTVRDVLRPILHKYGFSIDGVVIAQVCTIMICEAQKLSSQWILEYFENRLCYVDHAFKTVLYIYLNT